MCASADFAQFTLVQCDDGGYCCCGVARPDWDVQSRTAVHAGESDIGDCCFYVSDSGACWPTIEFEGGDWDGQSGSIEGDRIGMLLYFFGPKCHTTFSYRTLMEYADTY